VRQSLKAILLAGAVAALTGTAALASGGGGGGMSSGGGSAMPSASAPQYDPAAEYARAVTALQAKDYKAAAHAADRVTQAAPRSPDAWRLLGAAKAGSSDWKGARRAYEKAVKLAPDDAMSHAGLGQALGNLKDAKAQAELDWLKAKAQACGASCPAGLQAMTGMVESAVAGTSAEAPKPSAMLDERSLLFAGPKAGDAAYIQAVSLINERRYDEALASLAAAETVLGPHPDILTYEGYTWRKKGDYARAESYYRQALAIAPNHVGATEYYGELKVARGDIAGAKLMLAKLDRLCVYGCADAEELRRWIDAGGDPQVH
jgi:Flp pilus assembly protein TadD